MKISRVAFRKQLAENLCETPIQNLEDLLREYNQKELINPLFSYICSNNILLRWRAVSAFGIVVPGIADEDMERARMIMRRFLWSLNDESGGIGWGAPESMAEIMCNHNQLREEYLHMLISYMREDGEELFADGNFLELPFLQQGLLWAIARVSQFFPEEMIKRGVIDDLQKYLASEDCQIVALASRCLNILQISSGDVINDKCREEEGEIVIYNEGLLDNVAISDLIH